MNVALAYIATLTFAISHAFNCNNMQMQLWMGTCDHFSTDREKCNDRGCHRALHWLIEPETRDCYVKLGMGPVNDLDKYTLLDAFCHSF
jgi:hypothetical protein